MNFNRKEIDYFLVFLSIFGGIMTLISLWFLTRLAIDGDFSFLPFLISNVIFLFFGVSVAYHRYFSHKSFKTSPLFEVFLIFSALYTQQGGIRRWIARHRQHHRYSDTEKDPHYGKGSHFFLFIGNNYMRRPGMEDANAQKKFAADYENHKLINFCSTNLGQTLFLVLTWITLLSLGGFKALACYSVAWMYVYLSTTVLINGVTHLHNPNKKPRKGFLSKLFYRNYDVSDNTQNSLLMWPLILDDAFHHNHHRYPNSFRMKPYEIELWYPVFVVLEKLGLVWDLNRGDEAA